jgi:hypothetical protein
MREPRCPAPLACPGKSEVSASKYPGNLSLIGTGAFVIGPDEFAIVEHLISADYDDQAVEKAMQLQGELRIELWCGPRKVADVPPAA